RPDPEFKSGATATVEGRLVNGAGFVVGDVVSENGNGVYAGLCLGAEDGIGRSFGYTMSKSWGQVYQGVKGLFD
ncbi:hypothetical protein, partial [Andreprevotia sp. IGB-42]|uniref:hypothetical protein n=1 Tax=Andreprevotia sp. IGB-42 TaxID=2497473 RepID=UPI001F1CC8F5